MRVENANPSHVFIGGAAADAVAWAAELEIRV
jgi:hypothetical protein